MSSGRVVLVVTFLAVAGLGVVFAVVGWDRVDRIAAVVSALVAVASLGVAVWAALTGPGGVRVSNTGRAVAGTGGVAVSGVTGPAPARKVDVDHSGDADASGGGEATSGVRLT